MAAITKLNNTYATNVVDPVTLAKYQQKVLANLADILTRSFGPHGSNTCIKIPNAPNKYTKDGHTILQHVQFSGIIEESIRSDIESITNNIVLTVGDGTTSAVILSRYIFESIHTMMEAHPEFLPAEIISTLNLVCNEVGKEILKRARPATLDDIHDIALISANGNIDIANMITDIYKECGMGVFIDVASTTAKDTTIKYYDGMTIDTGYSDSCYVTNNADNTAVVDHPKIYFFEDPIDTKEMGVFLDTILSENIIYPLYGAMQPLANSNGNKATITPTVIVAPRISRDMSSTIDRVVNLQKDQKIGGKLPIVIITETHQKDVISDICSLCNAKPIHKYIDRKIYEQDVEAGNAPTPETIHDWAGTCESCVAYSTKTKFIRPAGMFNEDGSQSNKYLNLLNFVETELSKCVADGEDAHTVGNLRRRLHSLKSNLVEIYAGGMSPADREAARDLIEDAVKNCRSAATNGVGWAANFSALLTLNDMYNKAQLDGLVSSTGEYNIKAAVLECINNAYKNLVFTLYSNTFQGLTDDEIREIILESCQRDMPMNLRTKEFDGKAISSIESDIIIMHSVARIIGIMVTCNQFLTPNPQFNVYTEIEEVK